MSAVTPPFPVVPPWLETRLRTSFEAHFEASVYGPLNGFLNIIFPISQKFIVKPQGLLRTQVEVEYFGGEANLIPLEEENNDANESYDFEAGLGAALAEAALAAANASSDSYHDIVRRKKGLKGTGIPDFLIVKAGMESEPDLLLAVIEVKTKAKDRDEGWLQICEYLLLSETKNQSQNMAGLLIYGDTVEEFGPPPPDLLDGEVTWHPLHIHRNAATNLDFRRNIYNIAARHWAI